jgi:hypothetical protein
MKIDAQKSVEGESKGLILGLTHWAPISGRLPRALFTHEPRGMHIFRNLLADSQIGNLG